MDLVRVGRTTSPYKVYALCNDKGDCPVLDFLMGLDESDEKLRNAMIGFLKGRVAENGPPKNKERCRQLKNGDGFLEFKRGRIRILWFWDEDRMILCTHAFPKGNKVSAEIKRAKAIREKYKEAKDSGNLNYR